MAQNQPTYTYPQVDHRTTQQTQEPTRRHTITPKQQTKFLEVRQKLIERFAISCEQLLNHWEPSPEDTLRVLSLLFPGQSVPQELLMSSSPVHSPSSSAEDVRCQAAISRPGYPPRQCCNRAIPGSNVCGAHLPPRPH